MITTLQRLLKASQRAALYAVANSGCPIDVSQELVSAIEEAQIKVAAQSDANVLATIDAAWDRKKMITIDEARTALAVVSEFPGRQIFMIREFRIRVKDQTIKRAKDIVDAAREVLE